MKNTLIQLLVVLQFLALLLLSIFAMKYAPYYFLGGVVIILCIAVWIMAGRILELYET